MKRHFLLMSLLAAGILLPSCSRKTVDDVLKDALAEAVSSSWEKAEKAAAEAVSLDGKNAHARLLHALALEKCGRNEEAFAEFHKASDLDPRQEDFHIQYHNGRVFFDMERYEPARIALEAARKIRPSDGNTLVLLGQTHQKLRNYDEALQCFNLLLTTPLGREPALWTAMGFLYRSMGNPRYAARCFRRAYNPRGQENPSCVLNLAVSKDQLEKTPQKALPFYRRYLKLTEGQPSFAGTRAKVEARIRSIR